MARGINGKIFLLMLFTLALIGLLNFSSALLSDGVVGYWSFDSNYSSSINGWNNVSGANASILAGGKIGSYVNFSVKGVLQYPNQFWAKNSNLTYNFWIKKAATTESGLISLNQSNNMLTTYFQTGNLVIYNNTDVNQYNGVDTKVSNSQWHMLTLIGNGTDYSFYIDGVFNGTQKSLTNLAGGYYGFYLSFSINKWLDGGLDEIGVWNRTLNMAEINYLYNNGNGNNNITQTPIVLAQCGGLINTPYINISFKNETGNQESLKVAINPSTLTYWTTNQAVNNTYIMSNSTEQSSYALCFSPNDQTVNVLGSLSIFNAQSQSRSFALDGAYTNVVTNLTAYLLGAGGQYVSFQINDGVGGGISGVSVSASRTISGNPVVLSSGTTDSSGIVTFWLYPFVTYSITASKSGFATSVLSVAPTQTTYTIALSNTANSIAYNYSIGGLIWHITPGIGNIPKGLTSFNLTLHSNHNNLQQCVFDITNTTGGTLASSSGIFNTSDCYLSVPYAVPASSRLKGRVSVASGDTNGVLIVIDSDALWINWDIENASISGTLKQAFISWRDLPEFGTDPNHQEYSRMVLFFLILFIAMGIFSFFTGYDLNSPGAAMPLPTIIFCMAAFSGWFNFTFDTQWQGNPANFLSTHIIGIMALAIMGGFLINYYRRGS